MRRRRALFWVSGAVASTGPIGLLVESEPDTRYPGVLSAAAQQVAGELRDRGYAVQTENGAATPHRLVVRVGPPVLGPVPPGIGFTLGPRADLGADTRIPVLTIQCTVSASDGATGAPSMSHQAEVAAPETSGLARLLGGESEDQWQAAYVAGLKRACIPPLVSAFPDTDTSGFRPLASRIFVVPSADEGTPVAQPEPPVAVSAPGAVQAAAGSAVPATPTPPATPAQVSAAAVMQPAAEGSVVNVTHEDFESALEQAKPGDIIFQFGRQHR